MIMKFLLPLALLCSVAYATQPVLLFGSTAPIRPALELVNDEDFHSYIEDDLKDSMVVAFLEPSVQPKNFLSCDTANGRSCYNHLKNEDSRVYYASVASPIETLKGFKYESAVILDGELPNVQYQPGTVLFLTFQDTKIMDSSDRLSAHDDVIASIVQKLRKSGKIVGVYTTSSNTVSRRRRDTNKNSAVEGTVLRNPNIVIFYTSFSYCTDSTDAKTCEEQTFTGMDVNLTENKLQVTLQGGSVAPVFVINTIPDGYFEMSSLTVNSKTFRILPPIQSPIEQFSYFCGNKTFLQYSTETTLTTTEQLKWNYLQIQVTFSTNTFNSTFQFDDPWHCVPFVSIPILAGLFVSVILLAILGAGICWIMDVNTMDRFDDPKGKTITINAGE